MQRNYKNKELKSKCEYISNVKNVLHVLTNMVKKYVLITETDDLAA